MKIANEFIRHERQIMKQEDNNNKKIVQNNNINNNNNKQTDSTNIKKNSEQIEQKNKLASLLCTTFAEVIQNFT